jgi:hypothetical protein
MREIKYGALALAMLGLLAACSDDPAGPAPAADDERSSGAAVAPECPAVAEHHDELAPGCWAIKIRGIVGSPRAELDLPAGFSGNDAWVWVNREEAWGAITLLPAGPVYRDPCTRAGKLQRVGRSVEEFVAALVAQKVTATTAPAPVTLGGHDGVYLELSVPRGFNVRKCPDQSMYSWDTGTTELPGADPGQLNRYWIVAVDGHVVVLALHTEPDLAPDLVEKYAGIVEAATFAES